MTTDVFTYASMEEKIFEQNLYDYERITTFFSDLSIAEVYGISSVKDTYKNVMTNWIGDIKYITEFVMALNHKCWEWYERYNRETDKTYKEKYKNLSQLYSELYYKAYDKVTEHYSNDKNALSYMYNVLD